LARDEAPYELGLLLLDLLGELWSLDRDDQEVFGYLVPVLGVELLKEVLQQGVVQGNLQHFSFTKKCLLRRVH